MTEHVKHGKTVAFVTMSVCEWSARKNAVFVNERKVELCVKLMHSKVFYALRCLALKNATC